jgi:hypothetical protein
MAMIIAAFVFGCSGDDNPVSEYPNVTRAEKLPGDISKRDPVSDPHPPILHSDEFEEPVPVPGLVNTDGAEDSPFILPDGNTIYFFFTPDVRVDPEDQVLDQVSGVWMSQLSGGLWTEAARIWLQEPGELSLDGAVCVQDDEMWFASARAGYTGVNMFTASFEDGAWIDWQYVGDRLMNEIGIGEVHLHGEELYFHSRRRGGMGDYDIWLSSRSGADWSEPVNLESVNSTDCDGWPFVTSDGSQLWFTRFYQGTPAIMRSLKMAGKWGEPELIVSQFAGEPTLDDVGNLFFVHHFYEDDVMIEADIYVAYRK